MAFISENLSQSQTKPSSTSLTMLFGNFPSLICTIVANGVCLFSFFCPHRTTTNEVSSLGLMWLLSILYARYEMTPNNGQKQQTMNQVVSDRAAWSVSMCVLHAPCRTLICMYVLSASSSSSSSLLLLSSSSQVYVPPGQLRTCSLTSHLSGHCRSICQLAVPYTKLFIPVYNSSTCLASTICSGRLI